MISKRICVIFYLIYLMKHVFPSIKVNVVRPNPNDIILECELAKWDKNTYVSYMAAQPPNYRQSYTGSGLPFPDAISAHQSTKNIGKFHPKSNKFSIKLPFPNAYYSHLGTRLVPPHVRLTIVNKSESVTEFIELGENIPFRTLSYQSNPVPRMTPGFYNRSHLKIPRSQEKILRSSGFTLKTPSNFWGMAIPHP